MNYPPYGAFSPEDFLAKVEAEQKYSSRFYPSQKKISGNTVGTSCGRPNGEEAQESFHNRDHFLKNMQSFNLRSEANHQTPVGPAGELPAVKEAFSNEKIQNAIFSLLEPLDLLRCRLVSSSWLRMATNDTLHKWKRNRIRVRQDLDVEECNSWGANFWASIVGRTRRLEDLTNLLDGMGSHPFPCSTFHIMDMTIPQHNFHKFFTRYGFLVKHLDVSFPTTKNDVHENEDYLNYNFETFDYENYDQVTDETVVYSVNNLLEFLTKLITEQMPNLETLNVKFDAMPEADFSGKIKSQLLVSIREGTYCAGKHNQNLRTIEFDEQMPSEIIEAVCCLAPKVEQLDVGDLGFWVKNKHLLHLFKDLKFVPAWNQKDSIEAIVSLGQPLYVKKLLVDFNWINHTPNMWAYPAGLLKTVFEKCCHSLEELHLAPIYFLPGTILPQMPKVKLLSLNSFEFANPKWRFLPEGISIATTFPALHTIEIHENKFLGVASVTKTLCTGVQVSSVKRIITIDCHMDGKIFQKHFPNAIVTMRE